MCWLQSPHILILQCTITRMRKMLCGWSLIQYTDLWLCRSSRNAATCSSGACHVATMSTTTSLTRIRWVIFPSYGNAYQKMGKAVMHPCVAEFFNRTSCATLFRNSEMRVVKLMEDYKPTCRLVPVRENTPQCCSLENLDAVTAPPQAP